MERIKAKFWRLWNELLKDENGIGEDAYDYLYDLAFEIDAPRAVQESRTVDATDGRYYVSDE